MSQITEATVDGPGKGAADRGLSLLWTATSGALVFHNLEEWWLGMTEWIAARSWLPAHSLHGDQDKFAVVLAIVSGAVLMLALTAVFARPSWSSEVLVFVAYAMMVNGSSHAVLSLLSWSLMPGVITGSIVLLPLSAFVIRKLPPVRWTLATVALLVITTVGVTAGVLVLASVLSGAQ
jgi:multisubunit Na+/H+ antiporter MnhE subunit